MISGKVIKMRLLSTLFVLPVMLFAQHGGTYLDTLEHQTLDLFKAGRYAEATDVAIKAVNLAVSIYPADDFNITTSLNNLAEVYQIQGQYDKAEPLFSRSLAIREKVRGPDDPGTGGALNNLAELYRVQGQFSKAEPLYIRTLAIFEKYMGADHPDTATVVNNLASLYQNQGRLSKAEALFARALASREKILGANDPDTAGAANNLGHVYRSEGQYAKAEALYASALDVLEKAFPAGHFATAAVLNNFADLYASQGQFARAEPLQNRAIAIYEKTVGPNHPETGKALNNLAEIYRKQGQYAKAEPLYFRAIAAYEQAIGPDHPDTVVIWNNLAELNSNQGQYSDAEPFYTRSLAICEKKLGPDHPMTALALNNLGLLYEAQRQYAKAEPLLSRAYAICQRALGPDHPDNVRQADNLAGLLVEEGRSDRARQILLSNWPYRISWLDNSLKFGRESFRRGWIAGLEDQLSLLVKLQADSLPLRSLGLEIVLKTKNRMSEELGVALGSGFQLDVLQDIWEQQRHLELTNPTDIVGRNALKEQEDKLIAEISTHSVEFRELTTTPSLSDIRSRLKGTALVEIVQFKERYLPPRLGGTFGPVHYGAYLLREDGDVGWLDLGPAEAIDKLIRRYRSAMGTQGNEAVAKATARELETLVFEPVRQALPGTREMHIAPDGLLHLIPYAALLDDQGQPLIRRFILHTLSTGRDLVSNDAAQAVQAPIITGIEHFGAPKPGRVAFPDIPGAESEADAVAKLIPSGRRVAAERVSRSFLLEQTRSPRMLHLATHGFYRPGEPGAEADPLTRSGIALYRANESDDGILTAKDAAMLRLRGTQLVVLSACETGVGEATFADGVVGLQRSMRLAGARSEILTLWPVNDEKTRELMVLFYRNLLEKKVTKSEALRQAQLAMADKGIDAYYWAPFVLYGDPGPLR